MNHAQRRLLHQARPHFTRKDAGDFVLGRKRPEQALHEAQTDVAALIDQLKSRNIRIVRPHLAVPDHAIPGELKASEVKLGETHANQPDRCSDISQADFSRSGR